MNCAEFNQNYYDELKQLLVKLQKFFTEVDDEYRNLVDFDAEKYLDQIISDVREKDGQIYVAIRDDEPVGFVQGVILDEYDLQRTLRREGWIGLLFVDENFRGLGAGEILLTKICDYFRSRNCDSVKLFCSNANAKALGFYKRNGFSVNNVELKLPL